MDSWVAGQYFPLRTYLPYLSYSWIYFVEHPSVRFWPVHFSPAAHALWLKQEVHAASRERVLNMFLEIADTWVWPQTIFGCSCFAVGSVCPCPYLLTQIPRVKDISETEMENVESVITKMAVANSKSYWYRAWNGKMISIFWLKNKLEIKTGVVSLLRMWTKQWNGPLL